MEQEIKDKLRDYEVKSDKYLKWYIKIIENSQDKQRNRKDGNYYENHHILPKSMFPDYIKDKRNLVLLTAREHYIVHKFLDKIYPNSNMFWALWRLVHDGQNNYIEINSKEYETLKIRHSILTSNKFKGKSAWNKGKKLSDEHRNNIKLVTSGENNPFYNKKHTEEVKIKMSNKRIGKTWEEIMGEEKAKTLKEHYSKNLSGINNPNFGRKHTDIARKNMSLAQTGDKHSRYGKKCFTNGLENFIGYECPIGYWNGMTSSKIKEENKLKILNGDNNLKPIEYKKKEPMKGRKVYNNGIRYIVRNTHPGEGWELGYGKVRNFIIKKENNK